MTAQNQSKDLNAIKTSLLKIAQDIGQPVPAPGQAAAPAPGSPEEVMGLIDDAIQVLEVAAESVPAETPGQPAPAAPASAAPVTAKTKSAQDEGDDKKDDKEDDKSGEKDAAEHDDDSENETDKEKELSARIAILEDEVEEKEKEKVAKNFVELYPRDVRQAKFDAIIASNVKSSVLSEQFKVAQDLSEAQKPVDQYVPATSQSGYLIKKASLNKPVLPSWRV